MKKQIGVDPDLILKRLGSDLADELAETITAPSTNRIARAMERLAAEPNPARGIVDIVCGPFRRRR